MRRRGVLLALLAALSAVSGRSLAQPTGAGDVVSLGRDLAVDDDVRGSLVVILGSVRLSGTVAGDVVLFGTDATFAEDARVEGDVLSIGGQLRFANGGSPGESIGGRLITVAAMEAAFLTELETSPLSGVSVSPLLLAFRLLLLAGWLVLGLALLLAGPRRLTSAAGFAPGRLLAVTMVGLSAVLSGLLVSALLVAVLPPRIALAAVGFVVALLGIAKVFGLAALFLALGRRLTSKARRGSWTFGDPAALAFGLLALGLVSLLPAAGALVWSVASVAGIGLALKTSFGRHEPLDLATV